MDERREKLDALRIERAPEEERARRRPRWWLALSGLAALLLLALGLRWWLGSAAAAEVETAPVRQVGGAAGGGTVLDASGYVTARRQSTISSKVTGKIVEVRVEEGMVVAQGQVLARLDDSLDRTQLRLAESQLEAARRALAETEVRLREAQVELGRVQRLLAAEVATEAELDAARAEVDSLAARLERQREEVRVAERVVAVRRQELAELVIRAPFAGVVVSKDAQPGEMISPVSAGGGFTRTGICTLVDMSSLEIEVDVNEAYIQRVAPGQRVQAVLDAYPDWRIPARVITTVPTADRQKATVKVRIGFDRLDPRILPDMGVKVAFLEDGAEEVLEAPRRLLIPRRALRDEGGETVVLVVEDGRVERRPVALGRAAGDEVEVVSGLAAGERVVVAGPEDLAPGDRVEIE